MSAELNIVVEPLQDAIRHISSKTPIGSRLRSAEWQGMPLALRQRGQFSATVESMLFVNRIQENVLKTVRIQRERLASGKEGALMDREEFAAQLREVGLREGLRPKEGGLVGTIQDPTAYKRAKLIFDVQTQQAEGYAYWKTHNDADVVNAAPAQELIRVESRQKPRDWQQRWREAAQASGDGNAYRMLADQGRMIARMDSRIWEMLGTLFPDSLGNPFPPFAFGSGMNVRSVTRDEAELLGLVQPGEQVKGDEIQFNDTLQQSVRDLPTDRQRELEDIFGGQVSISDGTAHWLNEKATVYDVLDADLGDPWKNAALKEIKRVISDTHWIDISPPIIPVRQANLGKANILAGYARTEVNGLANTKLFLSNQVDPTTPKGAFAVTHEVGHYLDEHIFGGGFGYGSMQAMPNPDLVPVLKAIQRSQRYAIDQVTDAGRRARGLASYWSDANETFARAYSQWIAEKNPNSNIYQGLITAGKRTHQWPPADFKPIGEAFDALFRSKGWL